MRTAKGLRAAAGDKAIEPESVQTYLEQKFGDSLDAARAAMETLAKAYPPGDLETVAYSLYEKFRPEIPEGKKGWGAKGELDLEPITSLAKVGGGDVSQQPVSRLSIVQFGVRDSRGP